MFLQQTKTERFSFATVIIDFLLEETCDKKIYIRNGDRDLICNHNAELKDDDESPENKHFS